jgi:hypothetical protein
LVWETNSEFEMRDLIDAVICLLCFLGPLELVLLFKELEEREPLTSSREMNLLKSAIHPINF